MRVLHRSGTVRPLGGGNAMRIIVRGVDIEARDADSFQIVDQRFELAEESHLAAALRRQCALGYAVLHDNAPASILTANYRTLQAALPIPSLDKRHKTA